MSVTSRGNTSAIRASTLIYDDNTPAAFTDLDLSAYVGERSVWAILRVSNQNAITGVGYFFRPNGSAWVGNGGSGMRGLSTTWVDINQDALVMEKTGSDGILEWYSDANPVRHCHIYLEGVVE